MVTNSIFPKRRSTGKDSDGKKCSPFDKQGQICLEFERLRTVIRFAEFDIKNHI
jgi:hypothetical protein